jgi:hypothetical protein
LRVHKNTSVLWILNINAGFKKKKGGILMQTERIGRIGLFGFSPGTCLKI